MLAELSLPELHDHVQTMAIPPGDTTEQAAFYRLLATYPAADTPHRLAMIATACQLRSVRLAGLLPLDLVSAYSRLESLARWRARQIAEDCDARR